MKWPQDQYDILKNAMMTVIDDHVHVEKLCPLPTRGSLLAMLQDPDPNVTEQNQIRLMWGCWRHATYDLQNDDTHPAFVGGRRRIVPYNPTFQLYPEGCNDSHLDTVIKAIGKELGFLPATSTGKKP